MSDMDEYNPESQRSAPALDVSTPQGGLKGSQIPDLMKIGSAPVNTVMDVESDILEPVVFSESFARFRLQNKGILHSNSKLTFSVDVSSGSDQKSFFPLNIGVHSLIERCVLKSGTKTICETSDFGHFMAFRSTFINPQHNKQRESITTGRMMARKWEYDDGDATKSGSGAGDGQSDVNAPTYTLDLGVEVDRFDKAEDDREYNLPYYNYMNGDGSASATKQSPVYQIALNDLFPFLKMNQLPCYMFREELDIELYFAKEKQRACSENASATSFKLDRDECKMVADYIFYPQEMMDAYAEQNSKMSFTYVDYRLVKQTVVADGSAENKIILNLGGAGRVVNKLFFGLEQAKTDPEQSICNVYTATGTQTDATGQDASSNVGVISHNVRYNDNFLYPVDIKNQARLYTNLELAEASKPYISKDEYSGEQNLITKNHVAGYSLDDEIGVVDSGNVVAGRSFWTEDRLNRNERVNSRGIELYQTWGKLPAETYTFRCWLELVRMAVLEDGVLTPVYA